MENPDLPIALANIVAPGFGFDPSDATYFLGRVSVILGERSGLPAWRDHLFAYYTATHRAPLTTSVSPPEAVIQIGTIVHL